MRRVTPLQFVSVLLAATLGVTVVPAVAHAAQKYPVPYFFTANIVAGATQQGSPPPGANDWSCTPSKAHPRAVVLVHGLFANMTDNWQTMSPLLANNGYCVFALTYGNDTSSGPPADEFGGLAPMEQSAAQLSAFVDKVLAATHTRKVDIVGHSEGATMPDYYIEYLGGAAKVQRYVGVSGVKHGTTLHGIGTLAAQFESFFPSSGNPLSGACGSCDEFLQGSDFVKKLEARAPAPGVIYTNLSTRYDELVSPYTSSFLTGKNVTNITMQAGCPVDASDHLSIISSRRTGRYILNALDPAHAQPAACSPVAPVA